MGARVNPQFKQIEVQALLGQLRDGDPGQTAQGVSRAEALQAAIEKLDLGLREALDRDAAGREGRLPESALAFLRTVHPLNGRRLSGKGHSNRVETLVREGFVYFDAAGTLRLTKAGEEAVYGRR